MTNTRFDNPIYRAAEEEHKSKLLDRVVDSSFSEMSNRLSVFEVTTREQFNQRIIIKQYF
jgi:hypothetical protein